MTDLKPCPSCREPMDHPSGDGCANMTAHKERAMTDEELIARLRENQRYEWHDPIWETRLAAADRIEQLVATNEALLAEREKDHANINLKADFIDKTLNQLAETEAKLAKAVEALAESVREFDCPIGRATLAEIKGESHE